MLEKKHKYFSNIYIYICILNAINHSITNQYLLNISIYINLFSHNPPFLIFFKIMRKNDIFIFNGFSLACKLCLSKNPFNPACNFFFKNFMWIYETWILSTFVNIHIISRHCLCILNKLIHCQFFLSNMIILIIIVEISLKWKISMSIFQYSSIAIEIW